MRHEGLEYCWCWWWRWGGDGVCVYVYVYIYGLDENGSPIPIPRYDNNDDNRERLAVGRSPTGPNTFDD